jgi:hypothetical protein
MRLKSTLRALGRSLCTWKGLKRTGPLCALLAAAVLTGLPAVRKRVTRQYYSLADKMHQFRQDIYAVKEVTPQLARLGAHAAEMDLVLTRAERLLERKRAADRLTAVARPLPGKPADLRPLPYPFQTYLTVNSDSDSMTLEDYAAVHELVNRRYQLNIGDQVFVGGAANNHCENIVSLPASAKAEFPADVHPFYRFLTWYNRGWIDSIHGWPEQPMAGPATSFQLRLEQPRLDKVVALVSDDIEPQEELYLTFEFRMPVPNCSCDVYAGDELLRLHTAADPEEGIGNAMTWTPAYACLSKGAGGSVRFRFQGPAGAVLEVRNLALTNFCRASAEAQAAFLEKYNLRFLMYTEHGKPRDEYVLGSRMDLLGTTRPEFLGDNPDGALNSYFIDLLDRLGVIFINPQFQTSQKAILPLPELIKPYRFNDGIVRYSLQRFFDYPRNPDGSEHRPASNVSAEPWLGFLLEKARVRSTQLGDGGLVYSHWGCKNPKNPGLSAATQQQLGLLRERHYNLSGTVPLFQRIWVAPAAEVALLARALHGARDNVHYDDGSNTVHIRAWLDPVSCQSIPAPHTRCFGLANLTIYVRDSATAHVFIDDQEYACFKRNPPDLTGRQSITLVDDSVPTTVFDEVDPLHRFGDLRTENAECYYRSTGAYLGVHCLEVKLTGDSGRATWTLPDVSSADDSHLRFAYRKTNPASKVRLSLEMADGTRVTAGEEGNAYGWRLPARHDTEWHEVVLAFADLAGRRGQEALPRGTLRAVALEVNGKPGDQAFFDCVQFLRNPVHPSNPEGWVLIAGKTDPPEDGVDVFLEEGGNRHQTKTRQGLFFFPGVVPKGSTVRLYAVPKDKAARYPLRGRRFEADKNEVELIIPLRDLRDDGKTRKLERVFRGTSDFHPEAGQIFTPKSMYVSSGLGKVQEFQNELQVSNLGFLDRDRRFDNPDGARRVLFLGNCNLFGHSTPRSYHANVIAEDLLAQKLGYPVEVPCLANSSVTFGKYWPYYQTFGKKFHPEVVCIFFQSGAEVLEADPDLLCAYYEYDPKHLPTPMFRSRPDGSLEQLPADPEFFRYVGKDEARHAQREAEKKTGAWYLSGINWLDYLYQSEPAELPATGQKAFDHFRRIARFYRDAFCKDGARMMIVLTCEVQAYAHAQTAQWKDDDGRVYQRERLPERLEQMCRELGIGFVDTGKYIREHSADPSMCGWRYDSHPSPYGFEWMAEAVTDYLLTTKFLEDLPYNDPPELDDLKRRDGERVDGFAPLGFNGVPRGRGVPNRQEDRHE